VAALALLERPASTSPLLLEGCRCRLNPSRIVLGQRPINCLCDRDRLAAVVARKGMDFVQLGKVVHFLAMRTLDQRDAVYPIGDGFSGFGSGHDSIVET
jgi:hypothetical protein